MSACGIPPTVQNRYLASISGCYLRYGEELDYASEPDAPPSRVRSRKIGFGGFEHLAAPSSPSRQRRGLSGRSHLSSKQMPKVDESGFPDEGKNFPHRPI